MSTYEIKTGSRKGGYLDIKPGIEVIDKDESSLYESNMIEMELGGMSDFYKNQIYKLEKYIKDKTNNTIFYPVSDEQHKYRI